MITYELLPQDGILIVTPEGTLQAADFEALTREVDPYISEKGHLVGLMIHAESFPGWDDFGALVSHLKFVREHHRKIRRIAAVTDSKFLSIMPRVVDHFISAKLRHFDYPNKEAALDWLKSDSV